jgi:serine/threonine-protein kinase
VWKPDGKSVTFTTDRFGQPTIFTVAADGASAPSFLIGNSRGVDEAGFSPDGKWLVYRVGSGGNRDIYARGPGDSTGRPLLHTENEEFSPTLSPDGRWLAFGTDESGRTEIYVRPFPDVGRTRWQISKSGGTEPTWSADGHELFYRSAKSEMVAAQVSLSGEFHLNGERTLFPTKAYAADNRFRDYAVSPDGKTFYFIEGLQGTASQMVVVTNWWEDLKAKVGAHD